MPILQVGEPQVGVRASGGHHQEFWVEFDTLDWTGVPSVQDADLSNRKESDNTELMQYTADE